MSYIVLARKYRPATFEEVAGQEEIANTLRNAVLHNRVAHAYLFTGPRGVGKTTMARILAKVLNCPNSKEARPCNECTSCTAISWGEDIDVIELDGASHRKVEEIKTVLDDVAYSPARAPHKIYIIDEVHMLSTHAFNSLLKTLEEPPPHVNFVLATTEPQKVPETIRSRCQRFDFRPLMRKEIEKRLSEIAAKEGIKPQPGLFSKIAFTARGSMRDAISLMEQVTSLSGDSPSVSDFERMVGATSVTTLREILLAAGRKDVAQTISLFAQVVDSGCDPVVFAEELVRFARDVLILKETGRPELLQSAVLEEVEDLVSAPGEDTDKKGAQPECSSEFLLFLISSLEEAKSRSRTYVEKRVAIETALLYVARMGQLQPIDSLIREIQALKAEIPLTKEGRIESNAPVQSAPKQSVAPRKQEESSQELPISPSDVKERWSEVAGKVTHNTSSPWLMAYLPISRVVSADQTAVSIAFPSHAIDSMKGSFDEVRMKQALEEGLEKVIGKKLSVRIERDETVPALRQIEHTKQSEGSSDESLAEKVRTVKSVFPGANIVR
jgi:DNA polymerase-3 subunit gamma/tau